MTEKTMNLVSNEISIGSDEIVFANMKFTALIQKIKVNEVTEYLFQFILNSPMITKLFRDFRFDNSKHGNIYFTAFLKSKMYHALKTNNLKQANFLIDILEVIYECSLYATTENYNYYLELSSSVGVVALIEFYFKVFGFTEFINGKKELNINLFIDSDQTMLMKYVDKFLNCNEKFKIVQMGLFIHCDAMFGYDEDKEPKKDKFKIENRLLPQFTPENEISETIILNLETLITECLYDYENYKHLDKDKNKIIDYLTPVALTAYIFEHFDLEIVTKYIGFLSEKQSKNLSYFHSSMNSWLYFSHNIRSLEQFYKILFLSPRLQNLIEFESYKQINK